jgi:hypothetical protein
LKDPVPLTVHAVAVRAGFTREGVVRAALAERDGSRADAVLFGRVAGD